MNDKSADACVSRLCIHVYVIMRLPENKGSFSSYPYIYSRNVNDCTLREFDIKINLHKILNNAVWISKFGYIEIINIYTYCARHSKIISIFIKQKYYEEYVFKIIHSHFCICVYNNVKSYFTERKKK